jgi:hypothetical protein
MFEKVGRLRMKCGGAGGGEKEDFGKWDLCEEFQALPKEGIRVI